MNDHGSVGNFAVQLKQKEKKDIRFLSVMASFSVIGYIALSLIAGRIMEHFGLSALVSSSYTAYHSFSLMLTFLTLLTPFLIAGHIEKKRTDIDICPFDRPDSPLLMALAVPAGAAVCTLGSMISNYVILFFYDSGITLSQPDLSSPDGGYALLIYLMRLTLAPAIIEEICFRGVIMQPLRKYGNLFAVLMSSMVFALTHGNLIQAPAAFISGIGIGYFSIATGTLWTGVCIHLLNNLIVAVAQYCFAIGKNEFALFLETTVINIILGIGLGCLVLFFIKRKTPRIDLHKKSALSAWEKTKAYIFNPAMIAMFIAIAYIMKDYIGA